MNITVTNEIAVVAGDQTLVLGRADAEKLYSALGAALGKSSAPGLLEIVQKAKREHLDTPPPAWPRPPMFTPDHTGVPYFNPNEVTCSIPAASYA